MAHASISRLFQQVPSSSGLVLRAAFFLCWFCFGGGSWGLFVCLFFCGARKDFKANLPPYLALAVEPERRQGTGSFYCSGALGEAAQGAEGAWGSVAPPARAPGGFSSVGWDVGQGRGLRHRGFASDTAISPTSPPASLPNNAVLSYPSFAC